MIKTAKFCEAFRNIKAAGNKETYTWEQINQALMNKGMSARRISDILFALNKVKRS